MYRQKRKEVERLPIETSTIIVQPIELCTGKNNVPVRVLVFDVLTGIKYRYIDTTSQRASLAPSERKDTFQDSHLCLSLL